MARYIDADKVLQELGDAPLNWTDSDAEMQEQSDYKLFKSIIESQSTADVVEVVRCKDCIFYKSNSCFNRQWDFETSVEIPLVRDADFCSYGERKKTNDR